MELSISISEDVRRILEQRAKASGQDMKTLIEGLVQATVTRSVDRLAAPAPRSDAEFEFDMQAFAEGAENSRPYTGIYSRDEIYFDHD